MKYLENEKEKLLDQNNLIVEENESLKTIIKRSEKNKLNR
jgi:hypothetical protein